MTDPPVPPERIPGLDALRGLAALSVLAFHFTTRFGMIFGHPSAPPFTFLWGQRGVEVFFVISGFAIQLSLEGTKGACDFVTSRAVRLYPTFWAALVLTFMVVAACGLPDRAVSWRDAALNVSMIPASLGAQGVDAVYWTLERELRFYGLVLLLLLLGLGRYTVHALLVTVMVQTIWSVTPWVPHWTSDFLNAGWAHLFASGALLARYWRTPSWTALGGLALCILSSRLLGFMQFACGAVAVALVWLVSRRSIGACLRPLGFLGKISYPLYLVHQYVGYVVMRELYAHGAPPSVAILGATAVGLVAATALHLGVERPCLDLLKRWRAAKVTPSGRMALQLREGLG
jgi:peptidoglycan/LPS O-acetylase OafA/YrhL